MIKRILRDGLEVTSTGPNGAEPEYARGMLVGIVTGLMARGCTFETAISAVKQSMPHSYQTASIPNGWLEDFGYPPQGV